MSGAPDRPRPTARALDRWLVADGLQDLSCRPRGSSAQGPGTACAPSARRTSNGLVEDPLQEIDRYAKQRGYDKPDPDVADYARSKRVMVLQRGQHDHRRRYRPKGERDR